MAATINRWIPLLVAVAMGAGVCGAQTLVPPVGNGNWQGLAGLGVISQPKYPGSAETRQTALPLVSADRGRYFIGGAPGAGLPAGVGAYLVQGGPWRLGLGLGANLRSPRRASDAARLNGLGDIAATEFGSLFGSYEGQGFAARSSGVADIGGNRQGIRWTLDLEGRCSPLHGLLLSAGPGLTWADSRYTRTFFGVDADQSARSGLPAYAAGSGVNLLRFSLGADYRLNPAWGAGLHLTGARLYGDAAHSPITERRAQNTFGLFASYHF